jgi:hypothetical protein
MQETGTYNDMFIRPYEAYLDGSTYNALQNRLDNQSTGKMTGSTFSGLDNPILMPSATHGGQIHIPHGWRQTRITFMMEVEVTLSLGEVAIYYFQGYTDYPGVSPTGSIDPNMLFVINSVTRMKVVKTHTPAGIVPVMAMQANNQYLSDPYYTDPTSQEVKHTLRPYDIFIGIEKSYIGEMGSQTNAVDFRNILRQGPSLSKRTNNIPSNYLANIFDVNNISSMMANLGDGHSNVLGRAISESKEDSMTDNPFILELSRRSGHNNAGTFRYGDLIAIDPGATARTYVTELSRDARAGLSVAGSSAYWNGSDRETVAATVLASAVPSLMTALSITHVRLRSTNYTIGGMFTTDVLQVHGITETIDLRPYIQVFVSRLETEILLDITNGGQTPITVDMDCKIYGDTTIELSFAGQPPIRFVAPTLCDSLLAPVSTNSFNHYRDLVTNIEHLSNIVADVNSTKFQPAYSARM